MAFTSVVFQLDITPITVHSHSLGSDKPIGRLYHEFCAIRRGVTCLPIPAFGDEVIIEPFAANLAPDPALLFDFRASLREWLRRARLALEDREALVLAVHEAVANGIDHGTPGEPVVVAARLEDSDVIIEITTAGSWEEPAGGGSSGDSRGRGLRLIRGLTNELEILVNGEFVIVRLRSAVSASGTTRSTL